MGDDEDDILQAVVQQPEPLFWRLLLDEIRH